MQTFQLTCKHCMYRPYSHFLSHQIELTACIQCLCVSGGRFGNYIGYYIIVLCMIRDACTAWEVIQYTWINHDAAAATAATCGWGV